MCLCSADAGTTAYEKPTVMYLKLMSCMERMIEVDDELPDCELSVFVNVDWVRHVVDWCMWGGRSELLETCVKNVAEEMQALLELNEDEEKEVEPDDFRFVLDRLVHWIEEEYKCVEVDRTE